jgi:hypothetical protein
MVLPAGLAWPGSVFPLAAANHLPPESVISPPTVEIIGVQAPVLIT